MSVKKLRPFLIDLNRIYDLLLNLKKVIDMCVSVCE